MAGLKHALKLGFKMGHHKSSRLKLDDVNKICADMNAYFLQQEMFSVEDRITATRLHDQADLLSGLVIGKVDKHRQGGFIA